MSKANGAKPMLKNDDADPTEPRMVQAAYLGAFLYLSSTPVLAYFPHFFVTVVPAMRALEQHASELVTFRCLMASVGTVGFIYIFAGMIKSKELIRLTVGWRLYFVSLFIINLCLGHLGQSDICPHLIFLIAALDIGVPILICLLVPQASFARTTKTYVRVLFKPPPSEAFGRDWFVWIAGWSGLVIIMFCTLDSLRPSNDMLFGQTSGTSLNTFSVGVNGLYCMTLMWVGHDGSDKAHCAGLALAAWCQVLAFVWKLLGMSWCVCLNMHVWAGLICVIHAYTLIWQELVCPREKSQESSRALVVGSQAEERGDDDPGAEQQGAVSPPMWIVGCSCLLAFASTVWYMFRGLFCESAFILSRNIHEQDLIVAIFATFVAFASRDLKPNGVLPLQVISWYLPMAAIWFTTETKLLAHLEVGTPFHPSWHARGLAPVFAFSEVINITFWLATMLLTAGGTTITAIYIFRYVKCTEGWSWLTFHGMAIILFTGWFMALFISGVGPPMEALKAATVPEFLPGVSKTAAVDMHKKDLIIGCFLLAAGPVAARLLPERSATERDLLIGVAWLIVLLGKMQLAFGN